VIDFEAPPPKPRPFRHSRMAKVLAALGFLVLVNYAPVAWGSIFGEENATLVNILVQSIEMTQEMRDLNEAAASTASAINDVRDTYNNVYAGVEEMRSYTFDSFLDDFKEDFYHQYPGIADLEGASQNLQHWEDTRAKSPWTAYEAITAVAGDMTAELRDDVRGGRVNIDRELILSSEASTSFSMAYNAEEATKSFDRETTELTRMAQTAGPGQSEQITARAMVMQAAQNSYIIRLLARGVRTDGVDATLDFAARMDQRNGAYVLEKEDDELMKNALRPTPMATFEDLE
jgi:hypothetical protein